jgi:hypothetical protein
MDNKDAKRSGKPITELWNMLMHKPWFQAMSSGLDKDGNAAIIIRVNKIATAEELKAVPDSMWGMKIRIIYQKKKGL